MNVRRFPGLISLLAMTAALPAPALAAQTPAAATSLRPLLAHSSWLGIRASAASLHGKVVLVDVFTFDCINCQNVTPHLRALYRTRGTDLAIVGVHTPETPYERERANVVANLAKQGVVWPVAIDNDGMLWNAYGVAAWPTELIFDRHGTLRKTVVGDSQGALVDATVKQLLAER